MIRRRLLVEPAIAVGSAALALLLTGTSIPKKLFDPVEQTTRDWRVRSVPRRPAAESRVVLVLFDSASVREWPYLVPFPRAVLADLVDAISAAGATTIGLDVYLDRRYPRLDSLDRGDARLRESIRRAGNVVLASATEQDGRRRVPAPPDPYFAQVAAGVGTADTPTPYETVRDAVLTVDVGDRLVPGFATALYANARGLDADSLMRATRRAGRLSLPTVPRGYARLPSSSPVQTVPVLFVGPPSRTDAEEVTFPAFSASAIQALGPMVPPEWFRGKIVLLGSGFHYEERFRTPFYDERGDDARIAGWTYGVEVHANALENLLTGRWPRQVPLDFRLASLAVAALLVTFLAFRKGIPVGVATTVALLLANGLAAFLVFGAYRLQLPVVAPSLAMVLAFLGSTSYLSIVEGREKRQIRRAFSQYVPPAVVAELVSDPSLLKLGGEKRPVTILFSDLDGFTSLSETLDPQELLGLLNRYLDQMTNQVLAEGGTLDKYIGDAVMALWGAPVAQPDHALRGCRSALRMQRRLRELNGKWAAEGAPELRMRVGINTGMPVVGNIGGKARFDYTALGDDVNLAARLEPACKAYGVGILVSDDTRRAAGDAVVTRELEVLGVYGRAEPLPVHELVGLAGEVPPGTMEVLDAFAKGLAAYRGRDFEMAAVYFGAALDVDPADGPSRLYLERCQAFVASPPPADWSFVERRQIK